MKSGFGIPTLAKNASRKDARRHKSSLEDHHSETASLLGLYTNSRDPSLFAESHERLNMIFNPEEDYTEFEIPPKMGTAQNQDLVAIFTSAYEDPSGSISDYSMDDDDPYIYMEEDQVTTEAEVERRPVGTISGTANTNPPSPSTDGTAKSSSLTSIIATGHQRQATSAANSQLAAPDSNVPIRKKKLSLVEKLRRNSSKVTNSDASRRDTAPMNSVDGESSSTERKEKVKSPSGSMFSMNATSSSHRIPKPLASRPFSDAISEPKGKKTFFKSSSAKHFQVERTLA